MKSIIVLSLVCLLAFALVASADEHRDDRWKDHHEPPEHRKEHYEPPEHRKEHYEPPEHRKEHYEPPEHKKEHHERPEHRKEHHEPPEHKHYDPPKRQDSEEHYERPEHKKEHHERPEHKKEHHERPEHKKEHHERPEHKKEHHEPPEHRHHDLPKHHDSEEHYEPPGNRPPPPKCAPVKDFAVCWPFVRKGYYGEPPKYLSACCRLIRKEKHDCICKAIRARRKGAEIDLRKALKLAKDCGKKPGDLACRID